MTDEASVRLPGEDPAYRTARNELLEAERDLRRRIERVAELRRALPPGGPLKEDYEFLEASPGRGTGPIHFSALFEPGKDSLVIYGFMYAEGGSPCPMCSAFLDSLDGAAPHIGQSVNLAVVAKASPKELRDWAARRGWRNLRLLSSSGSSYNADYLAENARGDQLPILNVFRKTGAGIRHSYATELFFQPAEQGQNPRHVDLLWPLWNMLDLTPDGRGDWYPALDYEAGGAAR
jgi:predicted dithiol-disulfide oxidoreductase (DUF899 family)